MLWRIIWRWRTLVCKRSPGRRLLHRWKESGTGFPHLLLQPQGNQVHLSSKSMDLLKVRRYCIGGSQLNWDVKVKRMENNTVAADEGLFGPLQFTYIWQMFKFWRILRPYHHLRLPPQQGQEKLGVLRRPGALWSLPRCFGPMLAVATLCFHQSEWITDNYYIWLAFKNNWTIHQNWH